jgi:hypothetical protein
MTGTATRAAARCRRPAVAATVVLALALGTSACQAPPHTVVRQCSGTNIGTADLRRDCTLAIAGLDRSTTVSFRIDSRRRLARVQGHFSVQQGTVRITVHGSTGTAAEVVVSPGSPGDIETALRLDRRNNGFRLHFEPDGRAAGLDGTLSYEPR